MRQCARCNFYSPDDTLRCANCGTSFRVERMAATTIQAPGRPPESPRKRKYTRFIPGLGPFSPLRRDPQTGQLGCGPGCLVSTILAAILALGGFLYLHQPHPPSPPQPFQAKLFISGNIVPGGLMQIQGSNFPAGSRVEITVDNDHVASSSTLVSASVSGLALWERPLLPSNHIVTVKSDRTFDTTIPIPSTWTRGSHHTVRAATQNAQASTQASIDVVIQPPRQTATVPPTPSPTPTPTVTPTPVPSVSGITPRSGPTNGGISVTITGTGFTGATDVSFGSTTGTDVNVVNDKQITVVSPAGSGTVDVRVTTLNGISVKSKADQFTYTPPPPVVSNVDPSGGQSAGGTSVTISGTGFTGATSVAFGSATIQCSNGDSCTINSDGTKITVASPAEDPSDASSNSVDVTVTTPNGTSQTNDMDTFTYIVTPVPDPSPTSPVPGG